MRAANGHDEVAPPIAAIFLVIFDKKVGYKVDWERSLPNVDLTGVDFKSLPSGLHNVEKDLVYFTHGDYAAVSAFVNNPAGEAERNADFFAIGVLVPLSYGRLGRSWMHAQALRDLSSTKALGQAEDSQRDLETYWESHKLSTASEQLKKSALAEPSSPVGLRAQDPTAKKRRSRALSDAAGFSVRDHLLSPDHPALSMPDFLDAFGPLVFPLYRAALLRKRILFLGSAPIQRSCNYVYDLSIFSNIPASIIDALPSPPSMVRIRPLFNVGIHDIPELSAKRDADPGTVGEGWIACTTDDILATKRDLYDVLVELPAKNGSDQWPKITASEGMPIRATQRDLRRYTSLRKELARMERLRAREDAYTDDIDEEDSPSTSQENLDVPDDDDTHPLVHSITSLVPKDDIVVPQVENESAIIEPSSWASIAYTSFLWWASAGERTTIEDEESRQDAQLLEDLISTTSAPTTPITSTASRRPRGSSAKRKKRASATNLSRLGSASEGDEEAVDEEEIQSTQQTSMILVAYFHRLTSLLMTGLGDIITSDEDETEDGLGDRDAVIDLAADDVSGMGLDVWSAADATCLADLGWVWWQRDVRWVGRGLECCGVRIC